MSEVVDTGVSSEVIAPESDIQDNIDQTENNNSVGNDEETSQPQKKKYKVKIDKEELEVDEDELVRGYQHTKAAHKRFQEAANLQKEVVSFLQQVKENPLELLQKLNITPQDLIKKSGLSHKELLKVYGSPEELAEQLLLEQIEEASLSEAEKKARAYDKLMAEQDENRKKQELTEKQKALQAREMQLTQQLQTDFENQIVGFIQTNKLAPTKELVASVAYEIDLLTRNVDDSEIKLTPELLSKAYHNKMQREKNSMNIYLNALDDERLLQELPEELVKKINNAVMKKYGRQSGDVKPKVQTSAPARKGVKLSDFFKD